MDPAARPTAPAATLGGIGLRTPHYREMLDTRPGVGWLEVHSENYFGDGGQPHHFLSRLREHYPLSVHGVGLGMGSAAPLDPTHLSRLRALIDRYEPFLVSDHICWGRVEGRHLNDLLPLPYTEEALVHFCDRVDAVQNAIGRAMLVENVSSYLKFAHSTIPEWEFVAEIARRTGCGLLLDINNIHVNAVNHRFDPHVYLDAIPGEAVREIHLAGFDDSGPCLIDTHGTPVCDAVWALYARTVARIGRRPTLIEWDTDIPELHVLVAHAVKAESFMERCDAIAA